LSELENPSFRFRRGGKKGGEGSNGIRVLNEHPIETKLRKEGRKEGEELFTCLPQTLNRFSGWHRRQEEGRGKKKGGGFEPKLCGRGLRQDRRGKGKKRGGRFLRSLSQKVSQVGERKEGNIKTASSGNVPCEGDAAILLAGRRGEKERDDPLGPSSRSPRSGGGSMTLSPLPRLLLLQVQKVAWREEGGG